MSEAAPAPLVRRGRRNARYTTISNEIIDHPTLGPEARITLIYLLSKPDNWQLQVADIRRLLGSGGVPCGRNKAYAVVRELKGSAYVIAHEELRHGRFFRLTYYVFDEPVEDPEAFRLSLSQIEPHGDQDDNALEPMDFSPCTQIGETVKRPRARIGETVSPPCAQKRDPVKRHITKNRKKQTTESPPPSPQGASETQSASQRWEMDSSFAELWDDWPIQDRPTNQDLAKKLFEQLSPADRLSAEKAVSAFRSAQRHRQRRPLMIPYLRERLFGEFQAGPEFTSDGYFRITPEHPEWLAWKAELRRKVSEASWAKQEKLGFLLTRSRRPEHGSAAGGAT